jgi:hypothetical protein
MGSGVGRWFLCWTVDERDMHVLKYIACPNPELVKRLL